VGEKRGEKGTKRGEKKKNTAVHQGDRKKKKGGFPKKWKTGTGFFSHGAGKGKKIPTCNLKEEKVPGEERGKGLTKEKGPGRFSRGRKKLPGERACLPVRRGEQSAGKRGGRGTVRRAEKEKKSLHTSMGGTSP